MLACPHCNERRQGRTLPRIRTVRINPVDPAADRFHCEACGRDFTRYERPAENRKAELVNELVRLGIPAATLEKL